MPYLKARFIVMTIRFMNAAQTYSAIVADLFRRMPIDAMPAPTNITRSGSATHRKKAKLLGNSTPLVLSNADLMTMPGEIKVQIAIVWCKSGFREVHKRFTGGVNRLRIVDFGSRKRKRN